MDRVAFQRLPVVAYQFDGKEIRENDEMGYKPGIVGTELTEIETQRAKIPPEGLSIARRTWTNGSSPVYSKYVFHAHHALLVSMPTRAYNHEDPDVFRLPVNNDYISYGFEERIGW
jgi:hypothetical protein